MSEIVPVTPTTSSLPEKIDYAKHLAASNLLPRQYQGNPANLLFALEYADALGVKPIHAINSIHVIEGKPSASADLIGSLVRKAGHKLRVVGDDTYAEAHLIRADDPDFTYMSRWDLNKARAAGLLGKGVWKSYPGAMLRARAITDVCRMGASDALYGVTYTPEELGADTTGSDGFVPSEAPVSAPPAAGASGADRVRAAVAAAPQIGQEPEATGEVSDEPATVAQDTPAPDSPTEAQLRKMGALLREAGVTDRDRQLAGISAVIGRTIASRKELTKDEAGKVIDSLEQRAAVAAAADIVDAEIVPEGDDALWAEILRIGETEGMTAADLQDDFERFTDGKPINQADTSDLEAYLTELKRAA